MSCVDTLTYAASGKNNDAVHIYRMIENVVTSVSRVRDSVSSLCARYIEEGGSRRGNVQNLQRVGYEVCDTVITNVRGLLLLGTWLQLHCLTRTVFLSSPKSSQWQNWRRQLLHIQC